MIREYNSEEGISLADNIGFYFLRVMRTIYKGICVLYGMAKGLNSKPLTGRNFALTIILGVFIAIMLCVLVNLIVDYAYPSPQYDTFCRGAMGFAGPYVGEVKGTPCSFNAAVQVQAEDCISNGNTPIYEYDSSGCITSLKDCNDCSKRFDNSMKAYNRSTFFVFAAVGFILIVAGLFVSPLLLQISLLPAGAFLVIEAAVKNFDSKLTVIIVFSLLIVAAVYLALKKLR